MKRGILDSPQRLQTSASHTRLWMCINVLFSILVVLLNKYVYVHVGFPNLSLTAVHFGVCTVGVCISRHWSVFSPVRIPTRTIFPLSLLYVGYIAFTNLALQYNSVGTFLALKTLTIPMIILVQFLGYEQHFSLLSMISLIPILCGVGMHCFYDPHLSEEGILYSVFAVILASIYQVTAAEKQKELQVSSLQLLWYQAPLGVGLIGILALIFEDVPTTLRHKWSIIEIILIELSAIVSYVVNFTVYWIIGNTTAVEYNISGQSKFVLTLLGGYLLFQSDVVYAQLLGSVATLSGLMLHTHIRMIDATKPQIDKRDRVLFTARRM